jgi:hypothetical protein
MRHLSYVVLTSLALVVAACSDDDDGSSGSTAGAGGAETSGGEGSSEAGATASGAGRGGRGGSTGSNPDAFTDLPGKIRFINFVSDGTTGQALDLYWGSSIGRGEKAATIEYGEITEFTTPRHPENSALDPDEAQFFMVLKGDTSSTPASFLVQEEPRFPGAGTVLTIALAATDTLGNDLSITRQTFYEHELTTPPAGMAHVYGWDSAFKQIPSGNFTIVGADGICLPDDGEAGDANLGFPGLLPDGTTGLALFDANTDPPCDTGTPPLDDVVVAGHSYVVLGQADTYDMDARKAVLLEVGTEN